LQTTCAESWMTWLCWTSTDKSVMLLTVFYLARVEKSWEGILNRGLGFCVFTIDLFFLTKKNVKKVKNHESYLFSILRQNQEPPPHLEAGTRTLGQKNGTACQILLTFCHFEKVTFFQ
jgi:hypothetical protein